MRTAVQYRRRIVVGSVPVETLRESAARSERRGLIRDARVPASLGCDRETLGRDILCSCGRRQTKIYSALCDVYLHRRTRVRKSTVNAMVDRQTDRKSVV